MHLFRKLIHILLASILLTTIFVSPTVQAALYMNGPTVNLESIEVNAKEVSSNDRIHISMEVTDEDPIELVTVQYKSHSNTNKLIKLSYNDQTNLYEGSLQIEDDFDTGEWTLYEINATNSLNERTLIYANYIEDDSFRTEDLSEHSFHVTNTQPLSIDLNSISITKNQQYENMMDLSMKINNPQHLGRSIVTVGYLGPEVENSIYPNIEYFDLHLNDEGYLKWGSLTPIFSEKYELGEWKLISISLPLKEFGDHKTIYDTTYNNEYNLNPNNFGTADLSSGNFQLHKRFSDTSKLDISSLQMNKNVYVAGETVEITVRPLHGAEILDDIGIVYRYPNSNETLQIGGYYAPNQGKYIFTFPTTRYTPLGEWIIDNIQYSSNGMVSGLYNGELYGEEHFNLSSGYFSVLESSAPASPSIIYSTHVQTYGWLPTVKDGELSGTTGEAKRLEGIHLHLENLPYDGGLQYRTHVQTYGWLDWVTDGQVSGTIGQAKRLEAIQIQLTGEISNHFDIYYRVHAETYGWLDWAKNGQNAGTAGLGKRLEAIEVKLVPKGEPAPGSTTNSYIYKNPTVSYSTHVETYGWQNLVTNGQLSGSTGEGKRLEAINIQLNDLPYLDGIQYKTHVQAYGWQNWASNGQVSGTSGQAKRLEAIQIQLTGDLAIYYDIYYRVHSETYGWLDWAKNGQNAGTEGLAKRLEAIEIKLVSKGDSAPGSTLRPFVK